MSSIVDIHLLRHPPVQKATPDLVYGQLDVPVIPSGQTRGQSVAKKWIDRFGHPKQIYSSDLSRCLALAQLFATDPNAVRVSPALREQSMGAWEGASWSTLRSQPQANEKVQNLWNDYVTQRPPDGENLRDVSERVSSFIQSNITTDTSSPVLIVTHAGPIRTILCEYLHIPLQHAMRLAIPPLGHCWLQLDTSGAVLRHFGNFLSSDME